MATRLIPYYVRATDYDQAGEDALALTLSGSSENSVFIFNTTLGKTRRWNGAAFVSTPLCNPDGGTWNAAPIGYCINVQALTSSPVDGQTMYFGTLPKAPVTAAGTSKIYIRKAGTIKIAEIYCYSGTAGTAESWSIFIRKNNTTDTLIAAVSISASERVFSNSSLSISVAAGDYIEIKAVNPTWTTNPLTCIFGGFIYIE